MEPKIVYEITVSTMNTQNILHSPISITLKILYRYPKYELWVLSGYLVVKCGDYSREIEAMICLNKAMKAVIRQKLMFRFCKLCSAKIFFPHSTCSDCGMESLGTNQRWINNLENEKFSEHLGMKMKWTDQSA